MTDNLLGKNQKSSSSKIDKSAKEAQLTKQLQDSLKGL